MGFSNLELSKIDAQSKKTTRLVSYTLFIKRKLNQVKSGRLWGLILMQNYIDELRNDKKVFEENSIFEPPTIYSVHKSENY